MDIVFENSMRFDMWINENIRDFQLDFEMDQMIYESNSEDKKKNNENENNKFEKIKNRMISMISALIKKLKEFIEKFEKKCKEKMRDKKFKMAINRIKKSNSTKPIKFIDVWKLEKEIKSEARELSILCNTWIRSYAKNGKGVMAANKFEDAFHHIIRKHEEKIDQIKKTKETFPADKVKKWLLKNTNDKNEYFGMLRVYTKQIEQYKRLLEEVKLRKQEFIEKTGYDNGPLSFSRVLNNSSLYIKRNSEWLSLFLISSVLQIGGTIAEEYEISDTAKYVLSDNGDPEEAEKEKISISRQLYHDSENNSKLKKASKAMKKASVGTAAMGAYLMKKSAREKNSI